jgi:hypothetical protein
MGTYRSLKILEKQIKPWIILICHYWRSHNQQDGGQGNAKDGIKKELIHAVYGFDIIL